MYTKRENEHGKPMHKLVRIIKFVEDAVACNKQGMLHYKGVYKQKLQ